MLHPVNRLSTRCTTLMATIHLSFRSSQDSKDTLYTDVLATGQHLAHTTFTYKTMLQATEVLTLLVASRTTFPQVILPLILPVMHFLQEANISLQLILKCSMRQQLRTNRKAFPLLFFMVDLLILISVFFLYSPHRLRVERFIFWRNCGVASAGKWNTKIWYQTSWLRVRFRPSRDSWHFEPVLVLRQNKWPRANAQNISFVISSPWKCLTPNFRVIEGWYGLDSDRCLFIIPI